MKGMRGMFKGMVSIPLKLAFHCTDKNGNLKSLQKDCEPRSETILSHRKLMLSDAPKIKTAGIRRV